MLSMHDAPYWRRRLALVLVHRDRSAPGSGGFDPLARPSSAGIDNTIVESWPGSIVIAAQRHFTDAMLYARSHQPLTIIAAPHSPEHEALADVDRELRRLGFHMVVFKVGSNDSISEPHTETFVAGLVGHDLVVSADGEGKIDYVGACRSIDASEFLCLQSFAIGSLPPYVHRCDRLRSGHRSERSA